MTVLTGSGLTLLISAGIVAFGEQLEYTPAELYAISGGALVAFLVGERERVDQLREAFAQRATERSHEERLERFDELLARIEGKA